MMASFVRCCPSLELLRWNGAKKTESEAIQLVVAAAVASAPGLATLDLSGSAGVTSALLLQATHHQPPPRLTGVYLTRCAGIDDSAIVGALCRSPHASALVELDVGYSAIGDCSLRALAESCPWLAKLGVANTGVTGIGIELIARNGALEYLDCEEVATVDSSTLLALARDCKGLETLDCDGCALVSDAGVCAVAARCPQLRYLNVSGCDVTGQSLDALAQSSCTELHLNNCDYIDNQDLKRLLGGTVCRQLKWLHLTGSAAANQIGADLGPPDDSVDVVIELCDACHELQGIRIGDVETWAGAAVAGWEGPAIGIIGSVDGHSASVVDVILRLDKQRQQEGGSSGRTLESLLGWGD
jgi:hypothetical protein